MLFEVITKSNGKVKAQAKRTYTNFSSLDTIVNAKYSKQIRSGSLSKLNLPEAVNMSNIVSLGILREQLNQYLQELLKVKVMDVENCINYSSLKETKCSPMEEEGIGKSNGHLKLILGPENDSSSKYDESRTASVHIEEEKSRNASGSND